ncbi:Peroxiredoxin [Ferrimonas balearica DSM 9799]|uniref:Glutathione peroxidase n=1 Tax=Ferrimonas balearica (strain DSM 9799 / CCM 4581 / KCTC 23876 / PAT) TaxID=550540 RepID=E1ST50_FERBD|nr:glutathione peroxidase [Ferrimonas balearica]ADN76097.1 Peroxiredoxin [Ferrimonas balearica DSM 9799]MBY5981097.1 glutathione peroxidase [Ferrimonas balearica]
MSGNIYQFSADLNGGEPQSLEAYRGKVLLVVNTASACGFTPQYEGLQKLQNEFGERGFSVLAFPCNQFGNQESGDDEAIRGFCDLRFNIDFPLFSKIDVNGNNAHPLFEWLKAEKGGWLGDNIKWNFTKFLVDREGRVVERFAPTTKPESIAGAIEKLLA